MALLLTVDGAMTAVGLDVSFPVTVLPHHSWPYAWPFSDSPLHHLPSLHLPFSLIRASAVGSSCNTFREAVVDDLLPDALGKQYKGCSRPHQVLPKLCLSCNFLWTAATMRFSDTECFARPALCVEHRNWSQNIRVCHCSLIKNILCSL